MNTAYINMYYSFAEALGAKAITEEEHRELLRFHRHYRKHDVSSCNWYKREWMPFSVFKSMHKVRNFLIHFYART